jgi:signal transduction histidine kinase
MELEVAAREGRFEDEGWRVRKDGTRFWANVVISRMLDRDGKLLGFAKVTRDLSHRRQLEEERVARASLERALAEQKKIDELREQLIGIVGHDLRTPLTSVVAGAEMMLKRGMLSEADAKVTARIARSADRMTKIISQLLDFTRARLGGGMSVQRQPAVLAEICAQVIAEVQMANPDRALIFEADDDTRGLWDRGRLAQVVSNLIGNAIQHGGPGGPIEVRVGDCGEAVSLAVHNQGPPVPAELLPSIFDPFRRGNAHATSKTDGLGLGLFIVREMVRAHYGEIVAHSTEAEGTTFTVRLPRAPP